MSGKLVAGFDAAFSAKIVKSFAQKLGAKLPHAKVFFAFNQHGEEFSENNVTVRFAQIESETSDLMILNYLGKPELAALVTLVVTSDKHLQSKIGSSHTHTNLIKNGKFFKWALETLGTEELSKIADLE